ncbi:MAG: hypothetical protein ACK559_09135, partial [bacterium]
ATTVEFHRQHGIVGHRAHEFDAGHVPAEHVFLARVADGHAVVERARHLGDLALQLAGANDEQPPQRTVDGLQHLAVEAKDGVARAGRERDRTGAHVERAHRELAPVARRDQLLEHGKPGLGDWLDDDGQPPAAGQSEPLGLLAGDAVDQLLRCGRGAGAGELRDHVVLDTTARYRSRDHAVVA